MKKKKKKKKKTITAQNSVTGNLNKEAQEVWEILLANALDDFFKKDSYSINVDTLIEVWGKNKTFDDLNHILLNLNGSVEQTRFIENQIAESFYCIISHKKMNNKTFSYGYSEDFKEVILNPDISKLLCNNGFTSGENFFEKIKPYYLALKEKQSK